MGIKYHIQNVKFRLILLHMLFSRFIDFFSSPRRIGLKLLTFGARILDDERYIKYQYRLCFGKSLNLNNPVTFNEKLNWLKLYDRRVEYVQMVDKYDVKQYVANIIGEEYLIPTINVWNNVLDIDWANLPNQFVLKTTHGGGNCGVFICKDKSTLDVKDIVKNLKKAFKQDIYLFSREWPYKEITPRIIAEPYLEDSKTGELRDYKFFCFDGDVKLLFVASERQKRKEPFFDFFDSDYNRLPIVQGHPNSELPPDKPALFNEMKIIASKLSQGIPAVRVDLYEANDRIYFGELTFFHFGGLVPFESERWDYILGDYIKLPKV